MSYTEYQKPTVGGKNSTGVSKMGDTLIFFPDTVYCKHCCMGEVERGPFVLQIYVKNPSTLRQNALILYYFGYTVFSTNESLYPYTN